MSRKQSITTPRFANKVSVSLVALSIVGAPGCSSKSKASGHGVPDAAAEGGQNRPLVIANAVSKGDPNYDGQQLFLHETWGAEQLDEWPPADFMLSLMKSEPDVFGNQFEKFGFIHDPEDDLPVGFKRGTVVPTKVHEVCGMCHVARLSDGRLWLGAPNTALDWPRFQYEVDQRWVAAGHPSGFDAISLEKLHHLGPGRTSAETGDDPLIGTDFPVYYALGQRAVLNKLGTEKDLRTEVFLSLFGFGLGAPSLDQAKVKFPADAPTQALVGAYGSWQAPSAPAADSALIVQGKGVFAAAKCDSCHHPDNPELDGITTIDLRADGKDRLPGDDPKYPRGSVHTDPAHAEQVTGPPPSDAGAPGADAGNTIDPGFTDFINFIVAEKLNVGLSDGYRVPYLGGLWTSAPYLHNGSVPTLADLLKPATERPKTWNPNASFTFDTTYHGDGNGGHEFGTTLSATDKTALIAYLNSL